jgi:predicted DNA-binding transcriptional regulator YafY
MDRTERFYLIDRLLKARGAMPLAALMEELGVSRATALRDLTYMRERLNVPIAFDRSLGGYRIDAFSGRYALPGLWFNASEIHALLAMQQLLREVEPGLLTPHLAPLERRLHGLVGEGGFPSKEVLERIRLVPAIKRLHKGAFFEVAASALLARKQLRVTHFNRTSGQTTVREISPQRLVYYRDNWYLDSWCHLRADMRSFAVDALQTAIVLPEQAQEVASALIADRLDAGYGIFSHPGATLQWATLRFSVFRSRWVQAEQWHPDQRMRQLDSGAIELEIPYHDHRELIGDVLRFGSDCEVVSPPSLRALVAAEVKALLAQYADDGVR